MLKKWQQFLEERNKNGGDPAPKVKTEVVPDFHGKVPNKPPGGGKPYGPKECSSKDSKAPKGEKNEAGFAEKGDKALKYTPKTTHGKTADLRPVRKVTKSEGFIDATCGMNPSDFIAYMSKKNSNLGDVHEAVSRLSVLMKNNPSSVVALVGEARRNGYFNRLMAEMLQYPEAMNLVANLLGDKNEGMAAARRLVKAMNEMVGPPMHQTLGDPTKTKSLPGPDNGMNDDEEDGLPGMDDEMPDDDLGGDDEFDDDDLGGDDEFDDDDMEDEPTGLPGDEGDDEGPHSDVFGGNEGPGGPPAGGANKTPPFKLKMPKPSMMHRMMRSESTSAAVRNFLTALNS